MNKIERINAVLNGEKPDRAPISCWYHFGLQYLPGDRFADIVLSFFEHYDFDWLKVMNDYFYPMPKGMTALKSAEDLKQLTRFDIDQSPFAEQLKVIDKVSRALDGKAYFCDTIFDPYQALQRSPVGEHLPCLMKEAPEALADALDIVSENIIAYAKRTLDAGAHGIFMSVLAGTDQMSREDFLKFEKPFAMKVFEAVKDMGPMNTAHLHGKNVDIDNCLDFPVTVFSWEDRLASNPSLAEMREKWTGCVMGGLDNTIMTRRTPEALIEHTREGMQMGGDRRFFLANGCSTPGHMDPFSLKAMVETAQGLR